MVDSKTKEVVEYSTDNGLSDSAAIRQEAVRSAELSEGMYVIIPQLNFSCKTKYRGEEFNSPRVLIAKMSDDFKDVLELRSFKVSNFTAQMTCLKSDGTPKVKAEENEDGLMRLPRGTGAVFACRDYIPKRVTKVGNKNRLEITDTFCIKYNGSLAGYMPNYVKNSDGKYDVELDEDGEIKWQLTSIPSFTVENVTLPKGIESKIKTAAKNDSQFKVLLTNGCIQG